MKNILLSSVALVAFAGAAVADVSWTGSATLGYNDDIQGGVYVDADIDVALSQELNNGWTAAVSFGFELEEHEAGDDDEFDGDNNLTVSISNDMYALTYGDTEFAAVTHFSGTGNMEQEDFSEQDGEEVLKVAATFGGVSVAVSGANDLDTNELVQVGFGASGEFSGISFSAAYQPEDDYPDSEDDWVGDEIFGLSVGTSFSGADVTLAYVRNATTEESSTGVAVSAPMGAVTLGAFYVSETIGDDNYGASVAYAEGDLSVTAWIHDGTDEDFGVNIAYAMGDWGMYVGGSDADGLYAAGELDMGNGASFLVSYANDEDDDANDEVGPKEYFSGTTLAVSLSF